MIYKYFAAGYLVKDNKVLLVHHNKFNKWVLPGGHLEDSETPDQAAVREFYEETNLPVAIISKFPEVFGGDSNATPLPIPFYTDLEAEGFDVPHIGFFYFVSLKQDAVEAMKHQQSEAHGIGWFTKQELQTLPTFEQVRAVASYALDNYPK